MGCFSLSGPFAGTSYFTLGDWLTGYAKLGSLYFF